MNVTRRSLMAAALGAAFLAVACQPTEISLATSAVVTATELTWEPETVSPPQDLEFDSMRRLIAAGDVQLANGEKIEDPDLWASIVIAKASSEQFCTATVIGPHVLLTAAHCVDAKVPNSGKTVGGTVRFFGGPPLQLSDCTMHPDYAAAPLSGTNQPRSSEDYALCEINGNVGELKLESLGGAMQAGDAVLMSGYGCINVRVFANRIVYDSGKENGQDKLRIGEATIDATGVAGSGSAAGLYIRTRAEELEPILCPGDSGGPMFSGATIDDQEGPRRRVVAVNSKIIAIPDSGRHQFLSFMSAVSAPSFEKFLQKWTDAKPATRKVCGRGIPPGSQSCRA